MLDCCSPHQLCFPIFLSTPAGLSTCVGLLLVFVQMHAPTSFSNSHRKMFHRGVTFRSTVAAAYFALQRMIDAFDMVSSNRTNIALFGDTLAAIPHFCREFFLYSLCFALFLFLFFPFISWLIMFSI